MTAPGIQIRERAALPSPTPPTDTSILFVVAPAAQGPTGPRLIQSLDQAFGANGVYGATRDATSYAFDTLDVFFRAGGTKAYFARVTGSGATAGARTLKDGSAVDTLIVTANGPGTWGNSLTVAVIAGVAAGTYALQIALSGVVVEQSVDLTTIQDAVQWASQSSKYVTATQTGTAGVPTTVAAASLSGGNDGSAIADANYTAALTQFADTLGPGQVAAPGRTTSTVQLALLTHAANNNRFALIDLADSSSPSTLAAATAALAGSTARYGMAFAPWIQVQGVAAGTTRLVPPSAFAAALIARTDGLYGPGTPAAGDLGQIEAVGLTQNFTVATDRDTLNNAGVNIFRSMFGGIRLYGFRSLANPSSGQPYLQASQDRYIMGLRARLSAAAESFAFQKIDGQGHIFLKLQGALSGVLLEDYAADELYGDTPQDAFYVDVGESVNTSDTVSRGELHAVVGVRVAPFAELVIVEIAKIPITQTLPAAA